MIAVPQRCGLPHTCEHCAVNTGNFKYFPDRDYNCPVCYAVTLCHICSTHNIGNDWVKGNKNQFRCASQRLARRLNVLAILFIRETGLFIRQETFMIHAQYEHVWIPWLVWTVWIVEISYSSRKSESHFSDSSP
jgi:hypothetical protein